MSSPQGKEIKFSLPVIFTLVVPEKPSLGRYIGAGWSISEKVNGKDDGDVHKHFHASITSAAIMNKMSGGDAGKTHLFDLDCGTGFEKLSALSDKRLGDPKIGYAMFRERGWKTLEYLHNIFGVVMFEFLRHTLVHKDGTEASLAVYRNSANGKWCLMALPLADRRQEDCLAFIHIVNC
jgi:hypothetical protein